jgi:hypothetical protein
MESLGQYSLLTRSGEPVPCNAAWLSGESGWRFVRNWETSSSGVPVSIRDSIEYAQIGKKRWQWLSDRGEASVSLADAKRRIQRNPECEFAFALLLSLPGDTDDHVSGFSMQDEYGREPFALNFSVWSPARKSREAGHY